MEKMEIVSPIFLFEKQKVIALEDKVIVEYTSPIKEFRVEYKYNELKPRVVRGRSGDPSWTNLGNFFFGTAFIIAICSFFLFRGFVDSPYYRLVVLGLAAIGLVAHGFRLVKYEKVWFDEKDGSSGFFIKLISGNREDAEKMISYIIGRVSQVESKITPQLE